MKQVLLCVMDWGLGHATRCVPVIQELQRQGAEVVIASSGSAGTLLRKEFPNLLYKELPGYQPAYPLRGSMVLKMVSQLPRFSRIIQQEHEAVEVLVRDRRIDAVISDNRYGCYSTRVKSVLITHQVNVILSGGWSLLAPMVSSLLQTNIRRFQEVWVPDQPDSRLTEPFLSVRIPFKFIGWLSRFHSATPMERKYDVMAVVSGPEPQRAGFESIVRQQLKRSGWKALLVTGKPEENAAASEGHLEIVSHLPAVAMEVAICSSGMIIARSGYSTIMDLIALQKKAAFVPTPQQPEQLWLAGFLNREGVAFCMDQDKFALELAVKGALESKGLGTFKKQHGLLEKQIKNLLL